ncbi:MAG: uroporphyrinogen decarboxylase family protein, partial [Bdellovibrionota bacterium]
MNLFEAAVRRQNEARPPVWFMRQAGRYHSHYQGMRKKYSFIELCKVPEAACEATMGPIRDFDFDAAILFSDLLFPLEAMGMGLTYDEGPKLDWHLKSPEDLSRLRGGRALASHMEFQAQAMRLIRAALPASKGLIGFVGGPVTLYGYAVEGGHAGDFASARAGMRDGRFEGFLEKLLDLLAENMALQARAGADVVAVFDTAAGEWNAKEYGELIVPALRELLARFKRLCPDTPVIYYSRGTGPAHWAALRGLPISVLGVDWRHDLATVLRDWSAEFAIQGNIDPQWLFLEPRELERRLREVFSSVKSLPAAFRKGWICGLGHGVL